MAELTESTMTPEQKQAYIDQYGPGPYLAADALVIVEGGVLCIRRGKNPGKGQLALPGGFLNPDETFLSGSIRELQEETGIPSDNLVPMNAHIVLDDPSRDPRGRVISMVYGFYLIGNPEIKAADDAATIEVVPFSEFAKDDAGKFFSDHFKAIQKLLHFIPTTLMDLQ